jgi:hypothetical protein
MKKLLLFLLFATSVLADPPVALNNLQLAVPTGTPSVLVYDAGKDAIVSAALSGLTITGTNPVTLTATTGGGGNVSNSGTPTAGQMAQWTSSTAIKGVTLSGSGFTASIDTSGVLSLADFTHSGTGHAHGLVPDPGATTGTTKFLREDATWQVPPSGGSTPPGGVDTYVQYNDSNTFGGSVGFQFDKTAKITLGNGTTAGKIDFRNASNWTTTLQPSSNTNTYTITLPGLTTVLVGTDTTDTLSNKSIDSTGLKFNSTSGNGITLKRGGSSASIFTLTLPEATGTLLYDGNLGTNVATFLATPSSANLAAAVTSETGTGALVFGTSPDFTTGITIGTVAVPTISSTSTLTNKRINPRVSTSSTGNTTPTPNADTDDVYVATGMTVNMVFGAPTGGTPVDGQRLTIRILGTAARTLGFNAIYRFSSDLPAPTTTITTKTLYLGFIYNATDSKWDNVAQLNNF